MNNPLSYKTIQNSIKNFRHLKGDNFNLYDEPGTYWFKPIFYFYRSTNGKSETEDINNEGLLHPSWVTSNYYGNGHISNNPGGKTDHERQEILKTKFVSSAYNYLLRNDEQGRANLLQQFITLLSNIVTRSPWYFQEITGLDTVVDQAEAFREGKFFSDERKQIVFTLLPDSVDDRIGTLLDLYRSICYSWKDKKEILPANLRKFDMGVYVHGSMIQDDHSDLLFSRLALNGSLDKAEKLGVGYTPDTEIVSVSGKSDLSLPGVNKTQSHIYFEFHNCEIDLSSLKGGDTISNTEGTERKYNLVINYDDCYINRHNSFIQGAIGDIIEADLKSINYGKSTDANIGRKTLDGVLGKLVGNLQGATLGQAKQLIMSSVGNVLFGNLYGFSLTNTISDITSGRIISNAANEINKSINTTKPALDTKTTLYEPSNTSTINKTNKTKILGSLYKSVGMLNNL